jgi:hypothetical protein
MKIEVPAEQAILEEQIREVLNRHWHASAAGMRTRNTKYDDDVICIIPSEASESSGQAICRRSHHPGKPQVPTSSEFSETVISGSRNTQSPTRGGCHIR